MSVTSSISSPFPGMDPYLEDSDYWRGFHGYLTAEIVHTLNPQIVPKYYADAEIHTALEELVISTTTPYVESETSHTYPDINVVETNPKSTVQAVKAPKSLVQAPIERVVQRAESTKIRTVNIYLSKTRELVTAIELLSPANKIGEGLVKYQNKRSKMIQSRVNLVEIDLIRRGQRPGPEVNVPPIDTDYIVLLNRETDDIYRRSQIWPVAINEPLPTIPIPLLDSDPDVYLELNSIVKKLYETDYYRYRIDYTQPVPPPKLRPVIDKWWQEQQAGLESD